jgi:AraC-like DNA-binding protein
MPIPLLHPSLELRTYGGEVRRHAHLHHQAVLPVEGRLAMRIGFSSGAVAAGAGVFVAAGTDHTFSAAGGANRFVVIDVPAHGSLADALIDAVSVAPFFAVDAPLQGLLAYLSDAARLRPLERDEALNAAALLAAAIARRIEAGRAADGIARAIALAEERLGERLGITDLAAAAGMGRSRFHEAFRQRTGRTPAAFLLDLRLGRAATMIRGSDQRLAEIALAVASRRRARSAAPSDGGAASRPRVCGRVAGASGISFRASR